MYKRKSEVIDGMGAGRKTIVCGAAVDGWGKGCTGMWVRENDDQGKQTIQAGGKNEKWWNIYTPHEAATDSVPVTWKGVTMAAHGTPSFLNISSNVLKATGLTKLWIH